MNNDNTYQLLVDRIDGTLSAEMIEQTETLIYNDEEVAADWKALNYTVNNLREAGVYLQVGVIRATYEASAANTELAQPAKVRTMSTAAKILRIAAALVLV